MPSVIDNCTKWTTFAIDAEVEHYGTVRLCKSHNEVLDEARVLRAENERLLEFVRHSQCEVTCTPHHPCGRCKLLGME